MNEFFDELILLTTILIVVLFMIFLLVGYVSGTIQLSDSYTRGGIVFTFTLLSVVLGIALYNKNK